MKLDEIRKKRDKLSRKIVGLRSANKLKEAKPYEQEYVELSKSIGRLAKEKKP